MGNDSLMLRDGLRDAAIACSGGIDIATVDRIDASSSSRERLELA